ncbi:MAG: T9SS type A sorting domain-containing protein [Flavobacteriales bacterium]
MMRAIAIPLLLASSSGAAQLFTSNGAAIALQGGAQLSVKGSALINAGATIANNGTIDLTGDWTNNSGGDCFGNSEGTVIMNGAAQSMRGSAPTQFNHLQLLGATVLLEQDQLVGGGAFTSRTGVLALHDAHLHLNSQRLTLTNPAPSAIMRDAGMLISETEPLAGYGRVDWRIGAAAPANYVVPFGNAVTGHYLPLTMAIAASGAGTNGALSFATYPTDPLASPNNRPLPTGLPSLVDMVGFENAPNVVDRFWIIEPSGYSTAPSAALTFTYRDSEWNSGTNTIIEALLQAQRFNGATWSQPPNGVASNALNTVTTALTNEFASIWALVQGITPLPVELLDFDAKAEGRKVRCMWITASELNNDHFTVERSADGEDFHDIGVVQGAGTTQVMQQYALFDDAPLPGLAYYRLRQTDLDGSGTWSRIVPVLMPSTDEGPLVLWPNPATDALSIAGLFPDEHLVILDAAGRVVLDAGLANDARATIGLSALPEGAYFLRVGNTAQNRTARFIRSTR